MRYLYLTLLTLTFWSPGLIAQTSNPADYNQFAFPTRQLESSSKVRPLAQLKNHLIISDIFILKVRQPQDIWGQFNGTSAKITPQISGTILNSSTLNLGLGLYIVYNMYCDLRGNQSFCLGDSLNTQFKLSRNADGALLYSVKVLGVGQRSVLKIVELQFAFFKFLEAKGGPVAHSSDLMSVFKKVAQYTSLYHDMFYQFLIDHSTSRLSFYELMTSFDNLIAKTPVLNVVFKVLTSDGSSSTEPVGTGNEYWSIAFGQNMLRHLNTMAGYSVLLNIEKFNRVSHKQYKAGKNLCDVIDSLEYEMKIPRKLVAVIGHPDPSNSKQGCSSGKLLSPIFVMRTFATFPDPSNASAFRHVRLFSHEFGHNLQLNHTNETKVIHNGEWIHTENYWYNWAGRQYYASKTRTILR